MYHEDLNPEESPGPVKPRRKCERKTTHCQALGCYERAVLDSEWTPGSGYDSTLKKFVCSKGHTTFLSRRTL
jgi:hypothetical protein